ncbi:amidohydrolase family protein [Humisphaera borealis]|uniref:Amidohydrolase family protein n=1 Tax=Humisphaera borealis TaxID=2807512 RepID=A0A7M2X2Y4_9BACT|nr:amidohydrolase family protein [Humisphaera borealis]QOV92034.1 amidohydrolase family protein [Humisphaera borealis]
MASSDVTILRADWVAPMSDPVIANGAIAITSGIISDLGPAEGVVARFPLAHRQDLGSAVLMPGLVNAHVHLELSDLTPGERPASFVDWLLSVMSKGPPPTPEGEARVAAATRAGVAQCLRFGVTTVGDISRFPGVTRQALAESPLRAVSFGEVTAMGSRRNLLEQRLSAAMTPSPAPGRVISAVSPHAPYSIEPVGYERCLSAAVAAGVPIATHLAETVEESEFITRHSGPFRRLWNTIGGWDSDIPRQHERTTPEALMKRIGFLSYKRAILVHANYLADDISQGKASVVYCPRTHAYFGHKPHDWQRMLADGINVAVGTDSAASSPDLNLVDDLRLMHRQAPSVSPETLWRMATVNAAKALGMQGRVGELSIGAAADVIAFAVRGRDPLREVLDAGYSPTHVWIAGTRTDERSHRRCTP